LASLPGDQAPSASSGYSESNVGQGGGLLGMLLRGMQQERDQPGVDSSSPMNGAPEADSKNYGSPQGDLLGRLAAPQSQQSPYQLFPESNGLPLSDPRNPNFRQLARIPIADRSQSVNDLSDQPSEQPRPSYSPFGDRNSLDLLRGSRQSDQAAHPERSLPDRIQAYWDHPHPYGLISKVKEALNGIAQAVQGSIDATSAPSTEEEAFRQNLGRERGPVGAWQGASLLNPLVPRGAGGIFAAPIAGAWRNGLPLLPTRAGQGIDGSIANTVVPPVRFVSRNGSFPAALADERVAPRGVIRLNPTQPVSQAMGGLLGASSNEQHLPWVSDSPRIQPGIDESQAGRPPPAENGGGSGGGGAGTKSGGEDDCHEEIRKMRKICTDAFVNNWKSDYAVGPYYGISKKDWTIDNCKQGLISARCGGNPWKPSKSRYRKK
jgi:hypothetical protein